MTIDYKELLRKYIAHVVACEGTDFLGVRGNPDPARLTEDEAAELLRLAERKAAVPGDEILHPLHRKMDVNSGHPITGPVQIYEDTGWGEKVDAKQDSQTT